MLAATVGVLLGLMLSAFAPASAQSILPTEDSSTQVDAINDCRTLRKAIDERPGDIVGNELALKIRCGTMMLADIPHYFKHALSFVLNMIGTLAVIAVIRAGYIFMLSKDKEYAEGRKAIFQVVVGLLIASLSFTAAQIVLRFLFAVSNAS